MWVVDETSAGSPPQISLPLWQLLPNSVLKIFKLWRIEHPTQTCLQHECSALCGSLPLIKYYKSVFDYFCCQIPLATSPLSITTVPAVALEGGSALISGSLCKGAVVGQGVFGHLGHVFSVYQITFTINILKR